MPKDYVLPPTNGMQSDRVPDPPVFAVSSHAVCHDCDKDRPREQRCGDCAMTRLQDGKLPAGSTLVRY